MRKIPVYTHPAAGWRALAASARKLMDYHAFVRGSRSVLSSNQPNGGFDCPGCAWPDHKTHKTIDVCETGIKVLASETMAARADARFFEKNSVAQLQQFSGYELEHAGRLAQPMVYDSKQDRYVPINWADAFARIAKQLNQLASPDEALFYTSGRLTNEPAFLYQLMVRLFGTNNMPDCSNMCHEPTSVMLGRQLGVGKATVVLEDFEQAKLILMFGQNPATNHPRMLEMLAHAHKKGCRIIAINPMREQGLSAFRNPQKPTHMVAGASDKMVDEVVQIQIGGDVALLTGMAKWLLENNKVNQAFIAEHTSGFAALNTWLAAQTWQDIEQGCGITQAAINTLAQLVADSSATICTWGMGITQHVQGDDNVAMITNLLLLMGMIGVTGGGASPVRGHSNVQGDRTMGIHESPKQTLLDSLEKTFNRSMPQASGYNVVEGAKALIDGKIKAFMSVGGNFSVAAPDSSAIQVALNQAKLTVFVATKLNETMLYPGEHSFILPCLSRTERFETSKGKQFATIEDSICQIVPTQGQLQPVSAQLKAESQILAGLAVQLFDIDNKDTGVPWQALGDDLDLVRDYIADTIEGFADFNERIRSHERGFHLYHPARHRQWQTDSGKAQFEVPKYPITYSAARLQLTASELTGMALVESKVNDKLDNKLDNKLDRSGNIQSANSQPNQQIDKQDKLTGADSLENIDRLDSLDSTDSRAWQFTSVRSHDQFNTVIFGYQDRYRNTNRRDVLFMHPDEMKKMGWQAGDRVVVSRRDNEGSVRELGPLVLTTMDIAANAVATYYPECNDIMDLGSHSLESFTPSYKSATVTLKRVAATIAMTPA